MDPENVRRKRVRLFDPTQPSTNCSMPAKLLEHNAAPQNSFSEDERFARELQAQLDSDADGVPAKQLKQNLDISEDECFAWHLQQQYDTEAANEDLPPPVLRQPAPSSASGGTHQSASQHRDISEEANLIRAYATAAMAMRCAFCGEMYFRSKDHILQSVPDTHGKIEAICTCTTCLNSICFGCGQPVLPNSEKFGACESGIELVWHCDTARMVLIWILLCSYDHDAQHNKPQATATKPQKKKTPARTRKRGPAAGIGYGGGYGGYDDDMIPPLEPVNQQQQQQNQHLEAVHSQSKSVGQALSAYKAEEASLLPPGFLPSSLPPKMPPNNPALPPFPGDAGGYFSGTYDALGDSGKAAMHEKSMPITSSSITTQADGFADDVGYFSDEHDDYPPSWVGSALGSESYNCSFSPLTVDPDDRLTTRIMTALTLLLPSVDTHAVPTEFDIDPPAVLPNMLLRSSILDRAANLLRNDSLEDATNRTGLYNSLLNFVRALASHCTTSSVTVHNQRISIAGGHDLLLVSLSQPTRNANEKPQTSQALTSCLENIHMQAVMMLEAAKTNEAEFQNDDSQQMLLVCRNICDVADFLHANAPIVSDPGTLNANSTIETDTWQKGLTLREVPDDIILLHNYFGKEARDLVNPSHGRMRALIQDLTRLKTGLPAGIFVRYGSSRVDVMKILIVGPNDTPYENGLFEFDLYAPTDYPNVPPRMQFKTTGRGTAAFNPNLYSCGKICLSLLGTWSGPNWQPGKSTLLQVFVSIQAMIFCDEPYCNEPGWIGGAGTKRSKDYNRDLYPLTVKHAMLAWLIKEDEKKPNSKSNAVHTVNSPGKRDKQQYPSTHFALWDEISTKHFEVKEGEILKTVGEWVKSVESAAPAASKRRSNWNQEQQSSFSSAQPPISLDTGLAGRTQASDPDSVLKTTEKSKARDSGLLNSSTLEAHLRGALKQLQKVRRGYGPGTFVEGHEEMGST